MGPGPHEPGHRSTQGWSLVLKGKECSVSRSSGACFPEARPNRPSAGLSRSDDGRGQGGCQHLIRTLSLAGALPGYPEAPWCADANGQQQHVGPSGLWVWGRGPGCHAAREQLLSKQAGPRIQGSPRAVGQGMGCHSLGMGGGGGQRWAGYSQLTGSTCKGRPD